MSAIRQINDAEFAAAVQSGLTLVDFWAPWCGPCMKMGPVLEEVGRELDGRLAICKVNVDESGDRAVEYGVRNIPAMLVFRDGVKVGEIIGYHTREQMMEELKKFL